MTKVGKTLKGVGSESENMAIVKLNNWIFMVEMN
jgi:hypothetical protein